MTRDEDILSKGVGISTTVDSSLGLDSDFLKLKQFHSSDNFFFFFQVLLENHAFLRLINENTKSTRYTSEVKIHIEANPP